MCVCFVSGGASDENVVSQATQNESACGSIGFFFLPKTCANCEYRTSPHAKSVKTNLEGNSKL
jgi:hypothetical protein